MSSWAATAGFQPRAANELLLNSRPATGPDSSRASPMAPSTGSLWWVRVAAASSATAGRASSSWKAIPIATASCAIRTAFRWHDQGWRPPVFSDLVVYQFHVGVFYARDDRGRDRRANQANFLDVLGRIEYLADLGVTRSAAAAAGRVSGGNGRASVTTAPTSSRLYGLLRRPYRDCALPAAGERIARAKETISTHGSPAQQPDQSAEGADRHLPSLWHRRDPGRGL